jgi:hypothetical protein
LSAGRGRQARHLDIVLDGDRHAAERLAVAAGLVRGIEGARRFQRARFVQRDEGVEFGARFRPRQHRGDQRLAGVFSGAHIGRRLRRGQRVEIDRRLRLRRGSRADDGPDQGRGSKER